MVVVAVFGDDVISSDGDNNGDREEIEKLETKQLYVFCQSVRKFLLCYCYFAFSFLFL